MLVILPAQYGLNALAGNVWEWTADCYDVYPAGDRNASIDFGQTYLELRGGSWLDYPGLLRVSSRNWNTPGYRNNDVGFRCTR